MYDQKIQEDLFYYNALRSSSHDVLDGQLLSAAPTGQCHCARCHVVCTPASMDRGFLCLHDAEPPVVSAGRFSHLKRGNIAVLSCRCNARLHDAHPLCDCPFARFATRPPTTTVARRRDGGPRHHRTGGEPCLQPL